MKKYLAEFIGAFFLVLTVGMTMINPGAGILTPVAIGSALMIMTYAGRHISGAHFNPAVTIAMWLRGRCPASDVGPYLGSQIAGSFVASVFVFFLKDTPQIFPMQVNSFHALIAEFIGTFALVYVFLNTMAAKSTAGNPFYGLAIGFAFIAMSYALGPVSLGAFNPAIASGLTLMHLARAGHFWFYFLGDFGGAVLAAWVFKFINPGDE